MYGKKRRLQRDIRIFVSLDSEKHKHEPTLLKEDAISPAFPEACQVAAMILGLDAYISGESECKYSITTLSREDEPLTTKVQEVVLSCCSL